MKVDQIICGDCLVEMKHFPDKYFDLCLADPPYGIDYQSSRKIDKSKQFDKIANDKTPFLAWLPDVYRITKPTGCLLCFCRWDVQEEFKKEIVSSGFEIKSQVIWNRAIHGMGDLKGAFAPMHDIIWFATKGDFHFYSDRPKDVITVPRVSPDKMVHPNQKPVKLLEKLIMACVPENGMILDPFIGYGSSAVAATRENRRFIGIELNPEYVEIARKRVAAVPARLDSGRWDVLRPVLRSEERGEERGK
jgi:site-specific DNA-methyltransferase (adenine-specific)